MKSNMDVVLSLKVTSSRRTPSTCARMWPPWGILYETKVAQDVSEAKIGREVGEDLRGETLGAEETSVGVHVARAEGHGGGSADGFELRHESFGEETVEVVNAPERGNTLRDRDAVPRIRLAVRLRRQRTVSHDSGDTPRKDECARGSGRVGRRAADTF